MKISAILTVLLSGVFTVMAAEQQTDCRPVSLSLQNAVIGKPVEEMLKLLEKEVSTTPQCSCELIRSAIMGYKPTPAVVGTMVDRAINAAPSHMEVIVMCARAAAPDAEAEIIAVAMKVGYVPNPLDFPAIIGEGPAGQFLNTPNAPLFVNAPVITRVDP